MKKLLLVLIVASFIGFAFAYGPSRTSVNYSQKGITQLEDTTKTTKTKKTKNDCPKQACCKQKCHKSTTTTKKTKKNN